MQPNHAHVTVSNGQPHGRSGQIGTAMIRAFEPAPGQLPQQPSRPRLLGHPPHHIRRRKRHDTALAVALRLPPAP